MAILELAIDIGTSKTTIYQKNVGIVLSEPSVIAISQGRTAGLKCAGTEAKKLVGKATPNVIVNFPLFEGVITLPFAAAMMLKSYLDRVIPKNVKAKIHAIITVPCGVGEKHKETFENVAYEAGIGQALIVESPIATRQILKQNLNECLIIDIGGGKTDMSVTDKNGILYGCSLGIGGNNMDTGIIDYLSDELKFKVGLITAANSRVKLGSLNKNENSSLVVNGRDLSNGAPVAMEIDSKNIYPTVLYYYQKIAELGSALINTLDEITLANIQRNGAYIMGGASQISGIDKFLERALNMQVNLLDEPEFCVARGAGRFLEDKALMQTLYQ